MKKIRFSFFLMAVMTVMCFTACTNSNDDDNNDQKSNIVPPKYNEGGIACIITPKDPIIMSDDSKLISVEFTESGRAYFEVEKDGKKTFHNAFYTYVDNIYSFSGINIKGSIEDRTTLAGYERKFKINVYIKSEGGEYNIQTNSEEALDVVKTVGDKVGDVDIISSWGVRGIVIELKDVDGNGKDNFFKEFNNGNLNEIRKAAEDEDVEFNEKEKAALSKVIQYVSISTKHITLDYTDGTSDVADWNWVGDEVSNLDLKLLDKENMGNKFIVDDPSVDILFDKPMRFLNITFNASVKGEKKNYNASLTLRLIQQPDLAPIEVESVN